MTADQPSPLLPQRRFPEFAQSPGWDHAKVADLVKTVSPPKKLTTSMYLADGRFPIIDQSQSYICAWTDDDEAVITRPLPVIVFGDHTCALKFVNRPFAQGADGIKILTARRHVSTVYLYHQLTYRPVVMEEYKRHFSTLKDKVVCFPDPQSGEQQKIADCLGSLDDLITAEGRKLEALRQHKQGLRTQLFPQGDESVPRLRFPEFSDQWKETTLGKQCHSISSGKDKSDPEGQFDLYGSTGVIGKTHQATFADMALLVARVGANAGLLTKAKGEFGVTDNTIVISLKDPGNVDFILHYLENFGLNRMIYGSGQPLITGGQLKALILWLPGKQERQRIADCLSSLSACIAGQSRKVEVLKRHKQGLLQQLFPSLVEPGR